MDIMFILHAEHEMNCSTAAARHLASSGVDVYTAISGRPSTTVYALLLMLSMFDTGTKAVVTHHFANVLDVTVCKVA